jgi:hypothetical protein
MTAVPQAPGPMPSLLPSHDRSYKKSKPPCLAGQNPPALTATALTTTSREEAA